MRKTDPVDGVLLFTALILLGALASVFYYMVTKDNNGAIGVVLGTLMGAPAVSLIYIFYVDSGDLK